MTEQELYKKAESLYYQQGKELNAIDAFKELLKFYPNNLDGWTHLSTMQHKITDFDGAIFSINKAIDLAPDNAWIINQKCTLLSLISKFSADGQVYLDEQTKEAHEIKSYSTKSELTKDLISVLEKLIQLEGNNERKKHNYLWKLAQNYSSINLNTKAIDFLMEAEKSIPSKYTGEKLRRELANINREIAANHHFNKDYIKAIEFLNKAFEYGLDDFKRLMLADIYDDMGNQNQSEIVLQDLIIRINKKLESSPESAYISQKVTVLKRLDDKKSLKSVLSHFDNIPESEYKKTRKAELKIEIDNYLKQSTVVKK